MWDFKVSRPDLFELPAGSVGFAAGVEYRGEGFSENRDPRSDGTISFTDAITGELVNNSDMLGSSESPDAEGDRKTGSVYVEFMLPLLRDAALAQSLDLQVALRHENFSDVGSITKPRLALSWFPIEQLQIRAAYSEGFRAPNLAQVHQGATSVVNIRSDPAQAAQNGGVTPSYGIQETRVGNKDLRPEESENLSYGVVWTPTDGLSLTLDFWEIDQEGVIGIFGGQNHVFLDAELRSQGSFNPFVTRELTTDGTLGDVLVVSDRYLNFQPRSIAGWDFSVNYSMDNSLGGFDFKLQGAKLTKFDQEAGAFQQILVDAGAPVSNVGNLIEQEFRPEWRATFLATWQRDRWGAGLSANYVGEVFDIQTTADGDTSNPGAPLPVDSYTRVNLHADYTFAGGIAEETRLRVGIRNLFDEDPPLADEAYGYEGSLHSWMGRYAYISANILF